MDVLSNAEGTVATSADTVWAWRSGARVGRRPRGMATVALFYTVTWVSLYKEHQGLLLEGGLTLTVLQA